MLKANDRDTNAIDVVLVSLMLILSRLTPYSRVSIVHFELANAN